MGRVRCRPVGRADLTSCGACCCAHSGCACSLARLGYFAALRFGKWHIHARPPATLLDLFFGRNGYPWGAPTWPLRTRLSVEIRGPERTKSGLVRFSRLTLKHIIHRHHVPRTLLGGRSVIRSKITDHRSTSLKSLILYFKVRILCLDVQEDIAKR
ncbi:hypothetical protein PENSPDRAFT_192634 [Peniophora sp. CONT]|nr:hypothetical protein PENSPDRAFT_192634 [Peniophora sp. CONT]